ncbi:MAG: MerR family transcriptional regulator [Candidatus Omnitrophota bacterium]
MELQENLVPTQKLAKALGVSPATVNYYTNMGLFKIARRRGNIRLYDTRATTAIFDKIQLLRSEGYSLRLIQQKFEKGYTI